MSGPVERARENAVEIASTLVTGVWMLGMFTGQDWWLPALLVGYLVVVPIVSILAGEDEADEGDVGDRIPDESAAESTDEALATLRERYASGELTEEQFERKLERLLEVETVEDASEYRTSSPSVERVSDDGARVNGSVRERERE